MYLCACFVSSRGASNVISLAQRDFLVLSLLSKHYITYFEALEEFVAYFLDKSKFKCLKQKGGQD